MGGNHLFERAHEAKSATVPRERLGLLAVCAPGAAHGRESSCLTGRVMLDLHRVSASEHPAKFIATLASTSQGAVLSVVETNDFRQLVHISLQLRAGTDQCAPPKGCWICPRPLWISQGAWL